MKIEKKFHFTNPSLSSNLFGECAFISCFLNENELLLRKLNNDNYIKINKKIHFR